MKSISAATIKGYAKGEPKKYALGDGLYFIVRDNATPYWMLRYTFFGKRKEMTLGSYPEVSLAEARALGVINKAEIKRGNDPLVEKKRSQKQEINTVTDLFEDWFENDISKRVKYPNIPYRVFTKDLAPRLGNIPLKSINARDIRDAIQAIAPHKPTVANDALLYLKQIFRHGIKLDILQHNPASAFTIADAGGIEKSRERVLTEHEIKLAFAKFRANSPSFTRDNYLAISLLLCLGVRKSELCQAKWEEFDFENNIWKLPKERTKTSAPITIPLTPFTTEMLDELKVRAAGSSYVLPARTVSKTPYISDDTINRAIHRIFGIEPGKKKKGSNQLPDMEPFSPHDLRRTFRSLLSSLGVTGHIAERCLNHKLKGVEAIYDRYDYFEERKQALTLLSAHLRALI